MRHGLVLMLLAFLLAGPAAADERILSYASDLTVHADGGMDVVETITVRAEGQAIRRGIFRDFPTRYRDRAGNRVEVGFHVQSVQRNGQPEAFRLEGQANGVRVRIGSADRFLPHGAHTYVLAYRTTRQLGFFPDHDELYWNATGVGWDFPIDSAEVALRLPGDAGAHLGELSAYTGPAGARGEAYRAERAPDGAAHWRTTAPLGPREGLTIVATWPKGYVREPTREQRLGYILRDDTSLLVALVGLTIVLVYFTVAWLAVGKDPERGTIVPLFHPPAGLSAAAVRYVTRMGFDHACFAATVIQLATRGLLRIQEEKRRYSLVKLADAAPDLSPEEQNVHRELFRSHVRIQLGQENGPAVRAAAGRLKDALRALSPTPFCTNYRWFIPGLLASAGVLAASLLCHRGQPEDQLLMFWLTFWSIGVVVLCRQVVRAWRARDGSVGATLGAVFLTLFCVPFVGAEIAVLAIVAYRVSFPVLGALVLLGLMNVLFFKLLKAPTAAGRGLLDRIEGFRMYLTTAESQLLSADTPPEKTPELYQRYFPYALALGVEQPWSEKFAQVLRETGPAGEFSPSWYQGRSLGATPAAFAGALAGAMTSSIASASTPPGSSSGGGGGGSSGGGGGGGGGGGW